MIPSLRHTPHSVADAEIGRRARRVANWGIGAVWALVLCLVASPCAAQEAPAKAPTAKGKLAQESIAEEVSAVKPSTPSPFSLSLSLDKDSAALGETVKLSVELEIPEDALKGATSDAFSSWGRPDDSSSHSDASEDSTITTAYAEQNASESAPSIGFVAFAAPTEAQLAQYAIDLRSVRPAIEKGPHTGKIRAVFDVTPWTLGELEIAPPPFRVAYLTPSFDDLPSRDVETMLIDPAELAAPVALNVASQLKNDDSTGLLPAARPTKGAARLALTPWEKTKRFWPVAVALLALALAAWLLIRRAMRPVPERIIPPDEWATAELNRLAGDLPEDEAAVEDWHFSLGLVVRGYIARRWRFPAEEMTSYEVVESLAAKAPDLSKSLRGELDILLEEVDGVKFAREPASKLTCQDRLKRSRGFVDKTRPVEIDRESGLPGAPASSKPSSGHSESRAA